MNAIEWIGRNEGERLYPYCDQCGKRITRRDRGWFCGCTDRGAVPGNMTIGHGRNLDVTGISSTEATAMLSDDIKDACDDLFTFPWWEALSSERQLAVLDLRFNVGYGRFRDFVNLIAALQVRDFARAADEMLRSLWAGEVGERAQRDAELLRTGIFPAPAQ